MRGGIDPGNQGIYAGGHDSSNVNPFKTANDTFRGTNHFEIVGAMCVAVVSIRGSDSPTLYRYTL